MMWKIWCEGKGFSVDGCFNSDWTTLPELLEVTLLLQGLSFK
jgi:hypothetical protein